MTRRNDDAALAELVAATREALGAFQASQTRVSEVHAEFLKAHQSATHSFESLFQAHQQLIAAATQGGMTMETAAPAPPPPAVRPAPPPSAARPPAPPPAAPPATRPAPPPPAAPRPEAPKAKAPEPKPPAPLPKGGDVEAVLIAVLSEKTGYPAEMLTRELDLERDLGVDSIKRVEILAAVEAALPGSGPVDQEKASSWRTIAEIATGLGGPGPVAPAAVAPPAPAPRAEEPLVTESVPTKASAVRRRIDAAGANERGRLLRAWLREVVTDQVGAQEPIPTDWPLQELGVDSMGAMKLQDRLQTDLAVVVYATTMFDAPTVDGLADTLLAKMYPGAKAAPAAGAPKESTKAAKVGEMSDDEVAALLEKKLRARK